jgi:hypothetical protein
MKKNKLLILGLVALMLTCGLFLAGCKEVVSSKGGCPDGGDCYWDPATDWGYTCGEKSCGVPGRPKCNC